MAPATTPPRQGPPTVQPTRPLTPAEQRAKFEAQAAADKPIKVRATRLGYYEHIRRRPGDVFVLRGKVGSQMTQAFNKDGSPKVDPRWKKQILAQQLTFIPAAQQFSEVWMEVVAVSTPESTSSAPENIRKEHDRILREKMAQAEPSVRPGDQDVLT